MHRHWHNMNARYNGYFLANEDLKEVVKKIEKDHKDDFTQLLPVFVYPDETKVKSYENDFEKVIKRATGVIERHAIVTEKGKVEIANACKWIDENYTIIGISDFYKKEWVPALEIFQYVSQKYPDAEAKYRGLLWMMRVYNELGSLSKTEILIDDLKSSKDFPKNKKYKRELAIVSADCYIKRGNYTEAIKSLKEAIALTKKKLLKARYYYILAQLYTKQSDYKSALASYDKALKYHPRYEMVFNIKISKAGIYAAQQGNSKEMKRELIKMSKDEKNKEYLAQIYFSLAMILYGEKDYDHAIEYFRKSIEQANADNSQKAVSYLKLGDLYFDKQDYEDSKANYDSAITLLSQDYPDYQKIKDKQKSLTDLVNNLNVIRLQDSLQQLSKMSEDEREKAVEKMIKKLREEEQKRLAEEKLKQEKLKEIAAQNQAAANVTAQSNNAKLWYFYNTTAVGLGIADFNKKWGDRRLEDNWRRSQKQQDADSGEEEVVVASDSATSVAANTDAGSSNIKDKAYYLKNIPSGAEALAQSDKKIIDAYYNVGVIYKEQFNNNAKSAQAFEELLKRYPDNKYKLTLYYQLYRTYLALNNQAQAEYYKNILLNNYPDTEYAKIIRNPEYAKNLVASKSEIEKFYAQTYQYYSEGNYLATIDNCNKADTLYSKNYLMPQFDFLKAMAIGKTQDRKALEAALTKIIIKHPTGPIKTKAQEILDLMKKQATDSLSKQAPVLVYYWIAVLPDNSGNLELFKEKATMITDAVFATDTLTVVLEPFKKNTQVLLVKTFVNREKAMEYYNFMKDKKQIFVDLQPGTFQLFIISSFDYALMLKDKDVDKYLRKFDEKIK